MTEPALAAPAVLVQRCDPFGHARQFAGGPKHLMGGLYGPEYEGRIKWECQNPADGWYRMTCAHGHTGQKMPLCLSHVGMIGKRMAGICPRCVMPPAARSAWEDIRRAQANVVALHARQAAAEQIRAAITRAEDLAAVMNEMCVRGAALAEFSPGSSELESLPHKCRLTVREIS